MPPALAWYLSAFWTLSGDRPLGAMGGCGPIPFTAIDRFAARSGVNAQDLFARLLHIIQALDRVYLRHVDEQMRTKRKEKR